MRSKLYAVVMWVAMLAWCHALNPFDTVGIGLFKIAMIASFESLGVYFWFGGAYEIEDWMKRHLP